MWLQMLSIEERMHPFRSDSAEKEVAQNDVRELKLFGISRADQIALKVAQPN